MNRANIYTVGEASGYEIDPANYQVKHDDCVQVVEPRAFDVLIYLIEHRDRIVPNQELFEAFWPPHISRSVLSHCVVVARKALGDHASRQELIRSVRGRGYRFVGPVIERTRSGELVVVSAAADPAGDAAPAPTPCFVGREPLMAQLTVAVDNVFQGRGRMLLLAGEPGVGKTAVAHKLAERAASRGAVVWSSRCHDEQGTPAFWPWIQILRGAIEELDPACVPQLGAGAGELAELLPELRSLWPTLPAREPLPAEQARFRLFDAVAGLLKNESRQRPIVIILDDLQWADVASLMLLRFLARGLAGTGLLLLGSYRDQRLRPDHPLSVTLGALAREPLCECVAVEGFSVDEVQVFMTELAGRPCAAHLASSVHELSEGNPFFVQEVTRLLISQGTLDAAQPALAAPVLPRSVREAIEHRVNDLPPDTKSALSAAAVIGREYNLSLLRDVLDWPAERVLDCLDDAIDAGVILELAPSTGRYAFSHALVRATLYEALPSAQRARIHNEVAHQLEVSAMHSDDHLEERAHHLLQAIPFADAGKAIEHTLRVAERAFAHLAYEESARHYERALGLLDFDSTRSALRECGILLQLGRAQSISGQRRAARISFTRAAGLARSLSKPDLLAWAGIGLAGFHFFGLPEDPLTRSVLEDACEGLDQEEQPALLARALACLSSSVACVSPQQREQRSAKALALAQSTDNVQALAVTLIARHWAISSPDRIQERLEIAEQLFALSERTYDKMLAAAAHYFSYINHLGLGHVGEAVRQIDAFMLLARQFGTPADLWLVAWAQASRALSFSRLDEAEPLIEAACQAGERAQHPGAGLLYTSQRSAFLAFSGRYDELPLAYEPLAEAYPWARRAQGVLNAYWQSELGQTTQAHAQLQLLARHDFLDFPRDEHWLTSLWLLGATSAAVGDVRRSAQLYELLEPFADRIAVDEFALIQYGPVSAVLAMLASALGRWDAALHHAQTAQTISASSCSGVPSFMTRLVYASVLQLRGQPDDRRRAGELANQLAGAAHQVGAEHWSARALRLAKRAQTSGAA